jgi:hypothetical protein
MAMDKESSFVDFENFQIIEANFSLLYCERIHEVISVT